MKAEPTTNPQELPYVTRWFDSEHLREELQEIVGPYEALAVYICLYTQPGAEQATALRKLLESKDAAVRATIERLERDAQEEEEAGDDGPPEAS